MTGYKFNEAVLDTMYRKFGDKLPELAKAMLEKKNLRPEDGAAFTAAYNKVAQLEKPLIDQAMVIVKAQNLSKREIARGAKKDPNHLLEYASSDDLYASAYVHLLVDNEMAKMGKSGDVDTKTRPPAPRPFSPRLRDA